MIDLLLMENLVATDLRVVRQACELVFSNRRTHEWPPNLDLAPAHWEEPFGRLADEVQGVGRDVATALVRIRALVERILAG